MRLAPLALAALAALTLGACGARSGLEPLDPFDAAVPRDAPPPIDAVPPPDASSCRTDADCDDLVPCTVDTCVAGRCAAILDHAACDDGRFCTGVERCAPGVGCTSSPPSCADSVACTADRCDEAIDACVSEPSAALCPISHRCDPVRGCIARALAHDGARLYEIDLPGGALHELGVLPVSLTDIALHPDGTLYGAVLGSLVRVDYEAGTVATVVSVPGFFVGLDISPDGTIYGASDNRVDRLDPLAGTATTIARFPGGLVASGDLAFVEGELYATVRGAPTGGDWLVHVPLDGSRARIVGVTGVADIWGLAPFGTTLYGLTRGGLLLSLDVTDGSAREITRTAVSFSGAGAR